MEEQVGCLHKLFLQVQQIWKEGVGKQVRKEGPSFPSFAAFDSRREMGTGWSHRGHTMCRGTYGFHWFQDPPISVSSAL